MHLKLHSCEEFEHVILVSESKLKQVVVNVVAVLGHHVDEHEFRLSCTGRDSAIWTEADVGVGVYKEGVLSLVVEALRFVVTREKNLR